MTALKIGSKGDRVKELQRLLNILPDGDFGPMTDKAVKEYQQDNNLVSDGIVGAKTWTHLQTPKNQYTLQQVYDAVTGKGYKWFSNLNIVGIRNSDTDDLVTNKYDDHITVAEKIGDDWHFHCWKATTDPGLYWIDNPINAKGGTAILVPDQYAGVYKIDRHNGKYKALCQRYGKVKVYRDGNKDDVYDYENTTINLGYFGINIHRSSAYRISNYINKYSAGCQVFADPDDFDDFMNICYKAAEKSGNKFSYTLIESKDII